MCFVIGPPPNDSLVRERALATKPPPNTAAAAHARLGKATARLGKRVKYLDAQPGARKKGRRSRQNVFVLIIGGGGGGGGSGKAGAAGSGQAQKEKDRAYRYLDTHSKKSAPLRFVLIGRIGLFALASWTGARWRHVAATMMMMMTQRSCSSCKPAQSNRVRERERHQEVAGSQRARTHKRALAFW